MTLKQLNRDLRSGTVLPPETKSNLRPYKAPLEPVEEGFGFKGTVAETVTGTHIQCHICGYFYANLAMHVAKEHKMSSTEYKDTYQLEHKRGLCSTAYSEIRRQDSLRRSPKVKQAQLDNLAKGRLIKQDYTKRRNKSSLEFKNKRGSCYYQLLDKIEALGKKLGRTPQCREFITEYGESYFGNIRQTFGTWNQAVTFAGFAPGRIGNTGNQRYSRESVIAMIRSFQEIEGRPPRASDMGTGIPTYYVLKRLFGGGIIEARRAAGLGHYDFINEGQD